MHRAARQRELRRELLEARSAYEVVAQNAWMFTAAEIERCRRVYHDARDTYYAAI